MKSNLRNSLLYFLSTLLTKGISFIVLPIYAAYLTVEEFGVLANITVTIGLCTLILLRGADTAVSRFFHDGLVPANMIQSAEKGIHVRTFILLICALILFLTVGNILEWKWFYIPIIIFSSIANFYGGLYVSILRQALSVLKILVYDLSVTLATVGFGVIFLISIPDGIIARLIGTIIGGLMIMIFWISKKDLFNRLGGSKEITEEVDQSFHRYGLSMLPGLLAIWMFNVSDRYVISYLIGNQELGYYSMAANIVLLFYALQDAYFQVRGPGLMKIMASSENKGLLLLSKSLMVSTALMILLLLVISNCYPLFVALVGDKFSESWPLTLILLFSIVFQLQYRHSQLYLSHLKDAIAITYISWLAGGINLLLNVIFIPRYGVIAAALSTTFSFFVVAIASHVLAFKHDRPALIKSAVVSIITLSISLCFL